MIIAIDGPSGSGKGTLAKKLADHFDFAFLDTGLLYRAVAFIMRSQGLDPNNEQTCEKVAQQIREEDLQSPLLRDESVGEIASIVSSYPGVRAALLAFQKNFCSTPPRNKPGAILDGRDIGTVICPEADYKFFIFANPDIRAERRWKELQKRGTTCIYDHVLQDMKERDARDTTRTTSPLLPAKDAFIIDTSELTIDQVFEEVLSIIEGNNRHTRCTSL
ncbi:MAG: (d)CMP kinase [Alphaproteobacteria bacterium]|jgi:CMP/dCMP kinase|nr:(d)CMP kinase [Alphaproteobacteria bacterium]MBT5390175.1 (d)CMP kinase [Alphaproteobacteria bacterium]MBT5654619.1 (d)CMP kinase [Alphaproteobacteria bacterium]